MVASDPAALGEQCGPVVEDPRHLQPLYAAATHEGTWSEAVLSLVDGVNSAGASLEVHDELTGRPILFEEFGLPGESVPFYLERYHATCPRTPRLRQLRLGEVDVDEPSDVEGSEFFQDFLARWGLCHYLGATLVREPHRFGFIAVHRTFRLGQPTVLDLEILRGVAPHIRRALDVDA